MTGLTNTFGFGQALPEDSYSEFNALCFLVRRLIAEISTLKPVQVVAVHSPGGVAPAGAVDVLPLVCMLDGAGNATPHLVLSGLPYFRLQGGTSAIIIDPVKGDVGYALFADQDTSSVVASAAGGTAAPKVSPPGSKRKFDMSDGIYVGGILNGVPTQYVMLNASGMTLADLNGNVIQMGPTGVTVTPGAGLITTMAGNIVIQGNLQLSGSIQAAAGGTYNGNITTTGTLTGAEVSVGSVHLSTHHHTGVTTGGGNTGGPV